MPPVYPGGSDRITVEAFLKQPRMISRALTDLARKRFVADRIFAHGGPDQVAGGAAIYQRSESIYPDRGAEQVGVRSEYPRTGWSEALYIAAVKKYGLEVPISDESKRRNSVDQVARAQRKLANAIVKFVDTVAMTLILTDPNVLTFAASGDWSTAATDIVFDIAKARNQIDSQDEGYEADTLVVNLAQDLDLIVDKDIRDALPREGSPQNALLTGRPALMLGLRQIIATNTLTAGKAIVMEAQMTGTIADEQPMADEGYTSYATGVDQNPPVFVKTYRNDNVDETIVRGARFPAMWLPEPKSAVVITGA